MTFEELDELITIEPVPRGRPKQDDPALRQIRPTSETVKPSPSWWETASRDGFTRRAEEQIERMSASREAEKVNRSIGV